MQVNTSSLNQEVISMSRDLWLNLPVREPERAKEFYTQLGFRLNEQYSSQDGSFSLIVGDNQVVLMLFPESTFLGFTGNAVANSWQGTEVLFSLGANSRDEVDELALKAVRAKGSVFSKPGEMAVGCTAAVLPIRMVIGGTYSMDMSKLPKG
jgi:predicted lactoylglutathione lyase